MKSRPRLITIIVGIIVVLCVCGTLAAILPRGSRETQPTRNPSAVSTQVTATIAMRNSIN
ncbi:MAG: hypothetical protein L0287_07880 [Anaerolineae bacterium]|nr:hypothetical protein [Anaerolineae bacterium]